MVQGPGLLMLAEERSAGHDGQNDYRKSGRDRHLHNDGQVGVAKRLHKYSPDVFPLQPIPKEEGNDKKTLNHDSVGGSGGG
jgi:hypothetical protein